MKIVRRPSKSTEVLDSKTVIAAEWLESVEMLILGPYLRSKQISLQVGQAAIMKEGLEQVLRLNATISTGRCDETETELPYQ